MARQKKFLQDGSLNPNYKPQIRKKKPTTTGETGSTEATPITLSNLQQNGSSPNTNSPNVSTSNSGGGVKKSKVEQEWETFFDSSLVPLTTTLGLLLGFILLKDAELGVELGFTQDEASKLSEPLARIAVKHNIAPRVRKAITSTGDYAAIAGVLVVYATRVADALAERREARAAARKETQQHVISRQIEDETSREQPIEQSNGRVTNAAGFYGTSALALAGSSGRGAYTSD